MSAQLEVVWRGDTWRQFPTRTPPPEQITPERLPEDRRRVLSDAVLQRVVNVFKGRALTRAELERESGCQPWEVKLAMDRLRRRGRIRWTQASTWNPRVKSAYVRYWLVEQDVFGLRAIHE